MKRSFFSTNNPQITIFWIWIGPSPLKKIDCENINATIEDYQSKPHPTNTQFTLLTDNPETISAANLHPTLTVIDIQSVLNDYPGRIKPITHSIVTEFFEYKDDITRLTTYDTSVMLSDLLRVYYALDLHLNHQQDFTLYFDTDLRGSFEAPLSIHHYPAIISEHDNHEDMDLLGINKKSSLGLLKTIADFQNAQYQDFFEDKNPETQLRRDLFNPIGSENHHNIIPPPTCQRIKKIKTIDCSQFVLIKNIDKPAIEKKINTYPLNQ